MEKTYRSLLKDKDIGERSRQEFANDVLIGLSQPLKWLPTRYIYDSNGSELFRKISELPEYYLTRTETELLSENQKEICSCVDEGQLNIIELGCGDGIKTGILLEGFRNNKCRFSFCPIDISEDAVKGLTENLKKKMPGISIKGLVSEYFEGLYWLSSQNHGRNLVLFLGSNIGNFTPIKTGVFLSSMWRGGIL